MSRRQSMKTLPVRSVRGRIRSFIERHASSLGDDVLECGSRLPSPGCWWADNRDLATGKWTGCDLQPGPNVDVVCDMAAMPKEWSNRFSGVLCSEVLEHVANPAAALGEARRVLQAGGVIIVTTLTAFPIHGYPNDYRRWTEAGLRLELAGAGFGRIVTESAGAVHFDLNDHGESGLTRLSCPIHVFAKAVKC